MVPVWVVAAKRVTQSGQDSTRLMIAVRKTVTCCRLTLGRLVNSALIDIHQRRGGPSYGWLVYMYSTGPNPTCSA